jgi:hypothetical protein
MGINSLTLSWVASTAGTPPIRYQPQVRVTGSSTFLPFGSPVLGLSVVVTGLSPSTSYDFNVLAVNSVATTPSAIAVGVTAPSTAVAPSAPANLVITP